MNDRQQNFDHLLITGGTGYIGARLVGLSLRRGWWVTQVSRSPGEWIDNPKLRWIPWNLGDLFPEESFSPFGKAGPPFAVIHLAHDWNADEAGLNVEGSRKVIESFRHSGVGRFVLASSVSARSDALNFYGRDKWQVEQILEGAQEVTAKVGLVYGGPEKSLFGRLCYLVRQSPLLPMVGVHQRVQPIHIDEICHGLLLMATKEKLSRPWYGLASPQSMEFGTFLVTLAQERFGRRLWLLPLPLSWVRFFFDLVEDVFSVSFASRERLLGLAGLQAIESGPGLEELDFGIGPLGSGLATRRRRLLEGKALLGYVLGRDPQAGTLRRYLRALESAGEIASIRLGWLITRFPALIRFVEPMQAFENEKPKTLVLRLRLAVQIAEASSEGAPRFYALEKKNVFLNVLSLFAIGVVESVLLPVRFTLGRMR